MQTTAGDVIFLIHMNYVEIHKSKKHTKLFLEFILAYLSLPSLA